MANCEQKGFLAVITGPRGVGKDSLINYLGISKIVGHTTRSPRRDEIDGVDYHFVTEETFLAMKDDNQFVEHFSYPGCNGVGLEYKGTSRQEICRVVNGEDVAWRIGISSAVRIGEIIRDYFPLDEATIILAQTCVFYIGTPSLWSLSERLKKRCGGQITRGEIIRLIERDWEMWQQFKDNFNHTIINHTGQLEATAEEIRKVMAATSSQINHV